MQQNKQLTYRYFILAFSATFLVMALLFMLLVTSVTPQTFENQTQVIPAIDKVGEAYLPTSKDAITVLFIGTKDIAGDAQTFILARFDPARGVVPIVALPATTLVQNTGQNSSKSEPISDVYRYGGSDYTRNALANTLGVNIDRYVRISLDAFITSVNAVGTFEFELPSDLVIKQDGMHVMMHKGNHLLDGKKTADIISYQGFEGGEVERCKIAGNLAADFVNQRMDIVNSTVLDKVFEKIINIIDTDISYPDYDNRKEAAKFLVQMGKKPAVALEVRGSFSDDVFTLSDTFVAEIRQSFS